MYEPLGLLHVNILLDIPMNKGIIHVHMENLPPSGCYNGKGQLNGVHLLYWIKGLIIVYSMDLLKTFGNQSFLVPSHLSICCLIGHVDPSTYVKIYL